jgi:hypothetical protein
MDDGAAFPIFLVINGEGGSSASLCEDLLWEPWVKECGTFPKADVLEAKLCCAASLCWFVVRVFANAEEKKEGDDTEVGLCLLNGVDVCLGACAKEFKDCHWDC